MNPDNNCPNNMYCKLYFTGDMYTKRCKICQRKFNSSLTVYKLPITEYPTLD